MKRLAYAIALVLAAGVGWAQTSEATQSTNTKSTAPMASKTMSADVVSADPDAKTITVKTSPTGPSSSGSAGYAGSSNADRKTLPVDDKAVATLKTIKAGDKVTLTCRSVSSSSSTKPGSTSSMSQGGDCVAVTAIAKPPASKEE